MLTIYKLSRNAFIECIREPIYFLMLISAMVLIGLFPTAALFVFREQLKFVIDSAMATTLVFSLVVVVICSAHTISREMKNGTVLLLMSKPVTRGAFVLSKILGILFSVTVFVLLCNASTLISVLIAKDQFRLEYMPMAVYFAGIAVATLYGGAVNYFRQKAFTSNAILARVVIIPVMAAILYAVRMSGFHSAAEIDPEEFIEARHLIPALLLLFPAAWTMGSIATALATRLELVSNLTVCSVIFVVGLMSKYLVNTWIDPMDSFTGFIALFIRAILPNWQYFWMADAIASRQMIPVNYLLWSLVYVVFYIGFWTFWAMAFFSEREIARDSR